MSERILEPDILLREKQEIIDALTERLERTAEQLDRFQRTNGDRGHWRVSGVPAELVERQQSLCGDLERVIQQWETAQPDQALERIESQLERVQQLLLSQGNGRDSDFSGRTYPASDGRERTEVPASGSSAWESLKAELLSQSPVEAPETTPPSSPDQTADLQITADPFAGEPLSIPAEFDVDSAEITRLRAAVVERDECIANLLKRLRTLEVLTRPAGGWKSLDEVPGAVKERLETLELRLEQMLRLGEVELSLERAKLGREAARLRQREASLSRAESRTADGTPDAGDAKAESGDDGSTGDGRLLRMLGIRRER